MMLISPAIQTVSIRRRASPPPVHSPILGELSYLLELRVFPGRCRVVGEATIEFHERVRSHIPDSRINTASGGKMIPDCCAIERILGITRLACFNRLLNTNTIRQSSKNAFLDSSFVKSLITTRRLVAAASSMWLGIRLYP